MAYKLDKNTKTIVRAIMKDQEKRDRRKHTGQYTAFDRQADKAIEEAKERLEHAIDAYLEDRGV